MLGLERAEDGLAQFNDTLLIGFPDGAVQGEPRWYTLELSVALSEVAVPDDDSGVLLSVATAGATALQVDVDRNASADPSWSVVNTAGTITGSVRDGQAALTATNYLRDAGVDGVVPMTFTLEAFGSGVAAVRVDLRESYLEAAESPPSDFDFRATISQADDGREETVLVAAFELLPYEDRIPVDDVRVVARDWSSNVTPATTDTVEVGNLEADAQGRLEFDITGDGPFYIDLQASSPSNAANGNLVRLTGEISSTIVRSSPWPSVAVVAAGMLLAAGGFLRLRRRNLESGA